MKLTFLGTVSATPTIKRNVSGMALQFDQCPNWWLFDCGEGTQHQILKTNYTLAKLSHIFISHLHGDHCFGLMGLLASRGMQEGHNPLYLFGPKGIKEYVHSIMRITCTHLPYPIHIKQVQEGKIWDDLHHQVHCAKVKHVGDTFAFIVEEKKQPGKFLVDKAKECGIPPGPIYGKLKEGQTVTLEDGSKWDGRDFVEPAKKARKIVVVSDTCDASGVIPYSKDAQLLVHESTYLEEKDRLLATRGAHSTAADAAKLAGKIGVDFLILNHFSQRYEGKKDKQVSIQDLIEEACHYYPKGKVLAAKDFMDFYLHRSKAQ